jgi:hypothetical protein
MKKTIAKLLILCLTITGFGLAVFIYCGSKTTVAIEESFPPFNAKVKNAQMSILYGSVSLEDGDKFEQSLKTKKFLPDRNFYHKNITYRGASYDISSFILDVTSKGEYEYGIVLTINNSDGDIDASVVDDTFGRINGKLLKAQISKKYDKDMTPHFEAYRSILKNEHGFEEEKYVGALVKNNDNLYYLWIASDLEAIWRIDDRRQQ